MTEAPFRPTIHLEADSRLDWKGLYSSKFRLTERLHFDPHGKLDDVKFDTRGRKHFGATFGQYEDPKLCLKPFPELYNKQSDMSDPKSFRELAYVPHQKKISNKGLNSSSFFKHTKNKSLVMPATFVSMKGLKVKPIERAALIKFSSTPSVSITTLGKVGGSEVIQSAREYNRSNKLNWKERDRLQERLEDVRSVKSLGLWGKASVQEIDRDCPDLGESAIDQINKNHSHR